MKAILSTLLVVIALSASTSAEEADPWLIHPPQTYGGIAFWSASIENDDGDLLMVACAPSRKGTRVNVIPARPFIYPEKIVKVRYRIDDKKSVAIDFHSVDERGTMVLFQPAERMVRSIYSGRSHLVYQDQNLLAEFSLAGAREALDELRKFCPHLKLQ